MRADRVPETEDGEIDLRQLLEALGRRWRLLVVFVLARATLARILSFLVLRPESEAAALLIFSSPRLQVFGGNVQAAVGASSAQRAHLAAYQSALAAEEQREAPLVLRVQLARLTYQALIQKQEELRTLLSANAGLVWVAIPTMSSTIPVAPRKTLNTLLGAMAGLVLTVMTALTPEDLEPPAVAEPAVVASRSAGSPTIRESDRGL